MKKEIDGKVYVEVDYLNDEILDKANLYYNADDDVLTGIRDIELPERKSVAKIGDELPSPDSIGMLDEFMEDEQVLNYPYTPSESFEKGAEDE